MRAQNSRGIESSVREGNEFSFEHFYIEGSVYSWMKVPSTVLALELEALDHQHMGSSSCLGTGGQGTPITSMQRKKRRRQKTRPGKPQHIGGETKERQQRKYNGPQSSLTLPLSLPASHCILDLKGHLDIP